ncbi:MAG: response regulator, partial [Phycisphaerales bacterium]|nr:response regulator [Phycisphaerales bacterium]
VLLAGIVWTLGCGRTRAISLARAMTLELEAAKVSAERLAEIARRTTNAVIIADMRGRVEWVNEGFTRITGYTLDEAKGRKPGDLLQGPGTDKIEAARVGRALAAGQAVTAELVNYGKSGREYTIAIEVAPIRSEAGDLTGFMAIESDVTQQRHDEAQLRDAYAQLEAACRSAESASRAKSAFLANMSHEIRTPLTAIVGFTELLREEVDIATAPPQRIQMLDTIKNAGQHLLTVINDILDLSKIEADKMTVERIATRLPSVLQDVECLMRPKASGKGLSLSTTLATPVPEHILTDPTRLRQILMNLTGNAIKFTESGGVTIIASVATRDGTSSLVIDVEDTGVGMTNDQAGRLFHAFGQADDTMTRRFGGTGLGLTICRRLAAIMGGDAKLLRTEPGRGSCFRVALPLEPVPGSPLVASLDASTPKKAADQSEVKLQGRILLAEDGEDNQRLIAFHLRKAGATVEIAANGRIALDMIEHAAASDAPFDLLLTDMQMPEVDGYALARELRARRNSIPIIALTAHAMAEDRARCLDAGCDDYATKPIEKAKLLSTCAAWLNSISQPARPNIAA